MTWLINWLVPISLAAVGLGAYGLTGVRKVPAGRVGIVYRRFGIHHPDDRFKVRVHGASGPQASTLRTGRRYFRPHFLYKVEYMPVTYVPPGTIGVVVANRGTVPPPDQLLCRSVSCDYFQNGRDFLLNGGQRGRQPDVLAAGTYDINPLLFEVVTVDTIGQGRHGLIAADLKEISVPEGAAGVVIALAGAPPDEGDSMVGRRVPGHHSFQLASEFLRNQGQRGVQAETLSPGVYQINPWFARVVLIPTRVLILEWSRKHSKPASNFDNFDVALGETVINIEGHLLRFTMSQAIRIPAQSAPRLVGAFAELETAGWGASHASNAAPVQRFVEKVLGGTVEAFFQDTASELGALGLVAAPDGVCIELEERVRQALAEWGVEAIRTTLNGFESENTDDMRLEEEIDEIPARERRRIEAVLLDEEEVRALPPYVVLGVHDRSEPGGRAPGAERPARAGLGGPVDDAARVSQNGRRYLKGQCQESVPVGEPFSLLASIVLGGLGSAALKPFDVSPQGQDVLLVVHAPGLRLLGHQRMTVHVPADRDSEPVMFELCADEPGPRSVSVTAWLGGSYLGELLVEITAERGQPQAPHRDVLAEITTLPADGAVSLVVRYDPVQNAYRFEFRDEDNPDEVISNLAYEPGPLVEHLVLELDELAKDRSGYSAAQAHDYLINAGARLWRELVPEQLREQFWERQHRIRQLTILADRDAVPWELLYPLDPGHDAGFLVEQFPVTRAVFRRRPTRRLSLRPARFVLPDRSPPEARDEIEAVRRLLDPAQPPGAVISALTPLQDLIRSGDFGVLHFACHNTYDPAAGSSITLDSRFTPTLMTTAVIGEVLARSAPIVFINSCRSAGLAATYNRLDGWASKFLEAGAAAFIGSLWAVSDETAREFASEFYGHLKAGASLGKAATLARQAAASQPGDPTWLAYTVYGDPRATISQPQP